MANGPISSEDLRLGLERIARLEEEKQAIADDIKAVYSEYKAKGFCTKTMKRIRSLQKMKPDDRREMEAMLDLYKGALGMLDGTPLGRWALEKLEKEDEPSAPGEGEGEDQSPGDFGAPDEGTAPDDAGEAAEPAEPEPTIEDARAMGQEAARTGKPVTSNPFPARDVRRAAWDEAWCAELGSDGMDIPDALKPSPKPKKADPSPPPAAEAPAPEAPEADKRKGPKKKRGAPEDQAGEGPAGDPSADEGDQA